MKKYKVIEAYNDQNVGDILEIDPSQAQELIDAKRIEEVTEEASAATETTPTEAASAEVSPEASA